MSKAHETGQDLIRTEFFRLPVMEKAVSLLDLKPGSRGLEVGCGAGTVTLVLARTVGPDGHVTGLDQDADLLTLSRARAREEGLSTRIALEKGDMKALPWEAGAFDWLVSVDCAGYAPTVEPRPLVRELARVLKPGGIMGLAAWSSQMILPGYPALEARLNATPAGIAPFSLDRPPEDHFLRALGWFKEAGLVDLETVTLAGQCRAPPGRDGESRPGRPPGHALARSRKRTAAWPGHAFPGADRSWFKRLHPGQARLSGLLYLHPVLGAEKGLADPKPANVYRVETLGPGVEPGPEYHHLVKAAFQDRPELGVHEPGPGDDILINPLGSGYPPEETGRAGKAQDNPEKTWDKLKGYMIRALAGLPALGIGDRSGNAGVLGRPGGFGLDADPASVHHRPF